MSPISEFAYACRASRGARDYQEDSSQVWRPVSGAGRCQPVLAVLADGMGGHVSGETASRLACDQYVRSFSAGHGGIALRMEQSLMASNEALTSAIRDNGALKGMGCTFLAGYLDEEGLRWVSVGDSALLLYRNGTLRRLNADHSVGAMLNRQVEAGIIAPEIAKNDPRRRALRSALTGGAIPLKDCEFDAYALQASDWVILATDGLEVLSGDEIASVIQGHEHSTADMVARSLIEAVEQKREQYQDNTTVVVLQVMRISDLREQPTKLADQPRQDADLAKTVLVDSRGKRDAASELMPTGANSDCTPKEPARKSWWPRVKLLLLATAFLGAIVAFGVSRRTATAHKDPLTPVADTQGGFASHDQPCGTGGAHCQPKIEFAGSRGGTSRQRRPDEENPSERR